MGKLVEKKKKKKGRPSLLDLQKRSLKQQQQEQQQQQLLKQQEEDKKIPSKNPPKRNSNPNHRTPTPTRRSTRRNPNPDAGDDAACDDDDEDSSEGEGCGRREKKLKFVLKLPSQRDSPSQNSASCASDSNAEDDEGAAANQNKRKIGSVDGGSELGSAKKGEKIASCTNPTSSQQGTQLDSGPSTPLPDNKLLIFILDRLQKKDTYGVYSEPVDPDELPDYHDIIENPMDFATVRKKLANGAYANLEQFEKDVYLICSNAMQYNSPDTIYFRQARSIQELAKKDFENLRQDSDDSEPEPKVVRRGRPPTKHLKKPPGRPPLERAGSEFSSDATPPTGGDSSLRSHYDLRRGTFSSDKKGPSDSSERVFHGSRKGEAYTSWLAEQKSERNEEVTGSLLKGHSVKHAKKQSVFDENRRYTYNQCHSAAGGQEPSVLSTFDGERKQLMPVGLLAEFGYARSLARFAALLGPVAWKTASKKIEKSLPAGVKFGPGWVGENEAAPRIMPTLSPALSQLSQFHPLSQPESSSSAPTPSPIGSKGNESSERTKRDNLFETPVPSNLPSSSDGHSSMLLPSSAGVPSTTCAAVRSSEHASASEEAARGLNSHTETSSMNNGVGSMRFHIHQSPVIRPGMNGFNGTYGINIPAHMGKLDGAMQPMGFNLQSSPLPGMIPKTHAGLLHPVTANSINGMQEPMFSESMNKPNTKSSFPNLGCERLGAERAGFHPQPSWKVSSPRQKTDSVPPDLNIMFQSQGGSPSTCRADSTQPDLALQL